MERFIEPHIIELPKIEDPRGNLSFAEDGALLPFEIERVYWTYDIPSWREREGRALRTCTEVIFATSGQFVVDLETVTGRKMSFVLDRSNRGLLLPPMTWRTLTRFVTSSTSLILASKTFDEADYISDYQQFKDAANDALIIS